MTECRVFIVGPESTDNTRKAGFDLLKTAVEKLFEAQLESVFNSIKVIHPRQNLGGSKFNDWIFSQIDTCDFLIADMSDFNPNVVYEVSFAHALGVPCQYVAFTDRTLQRANANNQTPDIAHYFKSSLISYADSSDENTLLNGDFSYRIREIFATGHLN